MKDYYGGISFSGRIGFGVRAENEEEAKRLVYDLLRLNIDSEDDDILDIDEVTWDLIYKEPRGNMSAPFIHDFEIYED